MKGRDKMFTISMLMRWILVFFVGFNVFNASSAITQVGNYTSQFGNSVSYITVAKPTGVQAGDLMILNVVRYRSGNSTDIWVDNSGWTPLANTGLTGSSNYRGAVFYKVATSSEPDSYQVVPTSGWTTGVRVHAAIIAYRGVDANNPIDVSGSFVSPGTSTNTVSLSPITTTVANTMLLQVGMNYRTTTGTRTYSSWTTSNPGSLDEIYDIGGTDRTRLGFAAKLKPSAGSTGNGSFVISGNSYKGGIMLALRPEPPRLMRSNVGWGDWNTASSWEQSTDGGSSWVSAYRSPEIEDLLVTVRSGHTITVGTSTSTSNLQVDGTLLINGSSVTMTATNAVVNGVVKVENSSGFTGTSITFNDGGTYEHGVNGGIIPTATWHVNSTCFITGISSTLPSGFTQSFGNFTWQCYSQTANLSFATSLTTINGNFNVISTGTGNGAINLMFSGASTYTCDVGGNFTQSGGTFRIVGNNGSSTGYMTFNIGGDMILSGGSFDIHSSTTYTGSGTVNVTGNVNMSGLSTITETGIGTSTFNFVGTSPIRTFTKTGGTISNTVDFNVNSLATVDFGTSVLDGSNGSFTLNTGATLITANESSVGALTLSGLNGSVQVTGSRSYSSSANYILNGSGVQYTGNGLIGAANLTLNNSGTVLTNALTVAGILDFQSGKLSTTITDLLTVSNTNVNAITGVSASRYISGPLRRNLPFNLTGAVSYLFPVGIDEGYYPYVLEDPTTGSGDITVQVELKNENAGGTLGADIVEMSSTEYWDMTTTGNFSNSTVSATRPFSPGIYNSLAGSSTKTGQYNSLNGVLSGNSINDSDPLGTNRFILFAVKGTPPPVVTVSTSAISSFSYVEGNGPSSDLSFTVSGTWLISNISLQAPANFELSATGGASFVPVSVLTVPAVGGSINNAPVYVRMKAGLSQGAVAPATLTVSATDATSQQVTLSGTVTVQPSISFTPATLSGFTYKFGLGPSAQQSFTVEGTNLAANVILTPPSNYEISLTSGSGFVTTPISVAPSGGTLSRTVYVRLRSNLGVGSYSQSLTAGSTYAETASLLLNGSVTNNATLTVSNSFLSTFIYTLGTGPSGEQSFIVYGNELTGNVTVTAPANYQISISSGGVFGNSLTLTPSGGTLETTIYVRLNAGLGVNTYGPANLTITSAGAVVKGVALKGAVVGTSSPTVLVSNQTINGFGYLVNNGPSTPQRLTVSGASLGANITITPPSNYEISLQADNGFGSSPIVLSSISQRVNPSYIYIRLKDGLPPAEYNQTLAVTSGAVSSPVALYGKVFASPLISASGGGDYCTGSTINLVSTGDDIMNRYWTGPNDFYTIQQNPSITNATPSLSGIYTVTGNVVVSGNLVLNGDFEMGDVGFGSAYGTPALPYTTSSLVPEGLYAVVNLPSEVHNNFSSTAYDHTPTPGTKQMVINGNTTPGAVVWTQSVPVIQHAYYEFNYWLQSVVNNNDNNPSQLQLYVNGVAAGPVYTADPTTGLWTQFIYNTNAGTNTILNLELINQNIVAGGNDFALDDIVFQQILPASDSTEVMVNNSLPVSVGISYSPQVIYQNTPVSYTAHPVNAGTSPVYVWKVNGVAMGTNSSGFIYTPEDGDIVSVSLTSSHPCSTGNPATDTETMTVLVLNNFWIGAESTDWGNESNWTAGFVPLTGDNVEYATLSNYGVVAERDLYLDWDRTIGSLINNTTRRLVIPAGKTLIVNNSITTDGNTNRVLIKADSTVAHGSLIFNNPQNLPVSATVEMFSKASYDLSMPVNQKYNWQYFGIPVRSLPALPSFYGAYVRKKLESGTAINNHWEALNNYSVLEPFVGYEICQIAPKFYSFPGELVNSDFSSGTLEVTLNALYPGQHLLSNPYTAAIDIRQIEFGSSMDNTIFLYNTGSFNAWVGAGYGGPGTAPGTYVSIPKNLAGIGGVSRQVPTMSSMLVKVNTNDANAYINFNYGSVVMGNTELQRVRPENVDDLMASTYIEIEGKKSGDRMWIFTNENCSRDFDNGYDGHKILMSGQKVQLYAVEADGLYQVNSVDDMHNTMLAFIPGDETEYIMRFTHTNADSRYEKIYLHDLITNVLTDITESGSEYSFSSASNTGPVNRFRILTSSLSDESDEEWISVTNTSDMLYVQNLSSEVGEMYLYDSSGRMFGNQALAPNSISSLRLKNSNVMILKVLFPSKTITKKIVVR